MSRRDPWSLVNAVVLAAAVCVLVALWVLVDLQGWAYYSTPMRVRGYAAPHRMLKPSGMVGHLLGVAGLAMMVVPVLYALRKRWRRLSGAGSMRAWLEVHIFCGIVGPLLVTFHTSFRFNGIVSVAYWSMMAVMASGFIGRYLYVRLPRTIRGVELSHGEIRARVDDLTRQLMQQTRNAGLAGRVQEFEHELAAGQGRPAGAWAVRRRVRELRRELRSSGASRELAGRISAAMAERAQLLRRLAQLNRTRQRFSAWHVFHQPLVYVMFAIAAIHIGVAVYFGYAW